MILESSLECTLYLGTHGSYFRRNMCISGRTSGVESGIAIDIGLASPRALKAGSRWRVCNSYYISQVQPTAVDYME